MNKSVSFFSSCLQIFFFPLKLRVFFPPTQKKHFLSGQGSPPFNGQIRLECKFFGRLPLRFHIDLHILKCNEISLYTYLHF